MSEQDPMQDLTRLWQEQADGGATKMVDIRMKASKFERGVYLRNLLEYSAAAVVAVAFSRIVLNGPGVAARAGAVLILFATAYVVYRLRHDGSASGMPDALALTSCVEFHRTQLLRQRDLLRSVWRWYLFPFVPGLLVMLMGRAATDPSRAIRATLISAVVFLGIGWLNERAARRLDREIEALDAVR